MIDTKLQNLMQEELDGTLSSKRKEELNKLLNSNDEARLLMKKLRLLHSKLRKVEEVEPPADLKESVMSSLSVGRQSVKEQKTSLIDKIVSLVEMPRFQMAGMFSMGMAAALLLFVIAENYSGNQNTTAEKAVGTFVILDKNENADVIETKDLYTEGCTATVRTYRQENTIIAEILVDSPPSRTMQLFVTSQTPGELRFSGIEQSIPNLTYANFGMDYFSANVSGTGKMILAFEDTGNAQGPIQIELKTENSSVVETVAIQKVNL